MMMMMMMMIIPIEVTLVGILVAVKGEVQPQKASATIDVSVVGNRKYPDEVH